MKRVHWIATALLSLMMLGSATMYIVRNADVSTVFQTLGFPTWIIYPLAVAKLLGVVAILTRRSSLLAEWAYAGFLFDFLIALGAHLAVGDGESIPAIVAIALLLTSRSTLSARTDS